MNFLTQFFKNIDPRPENVKSMIRNLLIVWSHEQLRLHGINIAIKYKFLNPKKEDDKSLDLKNSFKNVRAFINSKNVSNILTTSELKKMKKIMKLSNHEYNTLLFIQKEYNK